MMLAQASIPSDKSGTSSGSNRAGKRSNNRQPTSLSAPGQSLPSLF